jgi:hypothetical protein
MFSIKIRAKLRQYDCGETIMIVKIFSPQGSQSTPKKTLRTLSAWVLAAIFFAVSPLVAQLPEQPQFQQAYDFFVRQRFELAIGAFQAYLGLPNLNTPDQIVANQFLAFSYYALRRGEANTTIRHILELDIHAKVDSGLFQPTYVDFFNYAKTQAVGRVSIRSTPPGAKVFFQGIIIDLSTGRPLVEKKNRFIGTTPLDTLLLTGSYTLVLERAGYRLVEENPEIQGGPNNLSYNLARKGNNLKWYATGSALLAGGAIYFLTKKEEVLEDLPGPPGTPSKQ